MYQSAMVEVSNIPSQHFEKFLSGHLVSQIPEEEESLDIMDLGKDKLEDMDMAHLFLIFGCMTGGQHNKISKFSFSKTIKASFI